MFYYLWLISIMLQVGLLLQLSLNPILKKEVLSISFFFFHLVYIFFNFYQIIIYLLSSFLFLYLLSFHLFYWFFLKKNDSELVFEIRFNCKEFKEIEQFQFNNCNFEWSCKWSHWKIEEN